MDRRERDTRHFLQKIAHKCSGHMDFTKPVFQVNMIIIRSIHPEIFVNFEKDPQKISR